MIVLLFYSEHVGQLYIHRGIPMEIRPSEWANLPQHSELMFESLFGEVLTFSSMGHPTILSHDLTSVTTVFFLLFDESKFHPIKTK